MWIFDILKIPENNEFLRIFVEEVMFYPAFVSLFVYVSLRSPVL